MVGELQKEGSVANPRDACHSCRRWVQNRFASRAETAFEDLSEYAFAEKVDVAFDPAFFRLQSSVVSTQF